MNETDPVEQSYLRSDLPEFRPGDTVKVHVRVVEAGRERTQVFQGVVIRRQGGGLRETFTVRKISFGVGVERTFPVHSPSIARLEVVSRGHVRRAKLYYLRERRGKKARIRERRLGEEELAAIATADAARAEAAERAGASGAEGSPEEAAGAGETAGGTDAASGDRTEGAPAEESGAAEETGTAEEAGADEAERAQG